MSVRVRFAPSPTGPLHIGGVRTALYNYLFAKNKGGVFILRIEDTDQKRYVAGAETYIQDALKWLKMQPQESPQAGGEYGPYRQSERSDIYKKYVDQLLNDGRAYWAFDTADELAQMRTEKEALGIHSPKYGHEYRLEMRNSLTMDHDEVEKLIASGADYVIRLKIDPGQTVSFKDEVRGDVQFQTDELDDKVLLKSDGLPTYHMANVVDDHLMEISHVIRGEEWLSSTPLHVLLYEALGWKETMPTFVHLPLILKPQGKGKLSKRDGAKFGFPVFPMRWSGGEDEEVYEGFKEDGFLPDAVINFLALLGWNPGIEDELMDKNTLAELFSLDKINKSGARFDIEKANWFNQQYIQESTNEQLLSEVKNLMDFPFEKYEDSFLIEVIEQMKPRANKVQHLIGEAGFFFDSPTEYDEKMIRKKWKSPAIDHWDQLIDGLESITNFNTEQIQEAIKGYMQTNELSFGAIFPLIRIAISGSTKGPDLFETIRILGKTESINRMRKSKETFNSIRQE